MKGRHKYYSTIFIQTCLKVYVWYIFLLLMSTFILFTSVSLRLVKEAESYGIIYKNPIRILSLLPSITLIFSNFFVLWSCFLSFHSPFLMFSISPPDPLPQPRHFLCFHYSNFKWCSLSLPSPFPVWFSTHTFFRLFFHIRKVSKTKLKS